MVMTLLKALWDLFNPIKLYYKIIKGKRLSDNHTIVKHVGGSFIDEHGRFRVGAFLSRQKDEGRPSYNWLDFFNGTAEQKMTQLRAVGNLTLATTAKFAELNVGTVRQKIKDYIPSVDIIREPTLKSKKLNKDYSHCVMTNIPNRPDKDYELSSTEEAVDLILRRNVINTHPSK